MRFSNLFRYGLWLGVVATAEANREEYHMPTPWVPHLILNSLSLLLPEIYRVLPPGGGDNPAEALPQRAYDTIHEIMGAVAHDNPEYGSYVAPIALGYILSHPKFNIYKGDLAKIRILGFGLDALPHGLAAFTLTRLVSQTAHLAAGKLSPKNPLGAFLRWGDRNPALFSALALFTATMMWESEEYLVHRRELTLVGGDLSKINMQWDVQDTERDITANFIGWALGALLESRTAKTEAR